MYAIYVLILFGVLNSIRFISNGRVESKFCFMDSETKLMNENNCYLKVSQVQIL